ncbi:hypothetical protein HDV05_006650 [Chytridiales sp. JEL 0842]|nr:hypothetical protein HDV05_006650 [Chytridiales sp. JEL 0842]
MNQTATALSSLATTTLSSSTPMIDQISFLSLLFLASRTALARSATGISLKSQLLLYTVSFSSAIIRPSFLTISQALISIWMLSLLVNPLIRVSKESKRADLFPYEMLLGASLGLALLGGLFSSEGISLIKTLATFTQYIDCFAILPQITLTWNLRQRGDLGPEYLVCFFLIQGLRLYTSISSASVSGLLFALIRMALCVDFGYAYLLAAAPSSSS